ncbi:MAG TPA: DNA polymerase IV, partial [Spirochaetia bacterium]|nr:DNA polymerase IV [Spirochaetia bacterium]
PGSRPVFFHVDLDAFYASVEQRDNPELKGRPVIVGAAPGHRGVVSACSYEARRFGIHSAMPISQAARRCPQGVYLPVRMERYLQVSREVMHILSGFTPHLQQISVDEAFLDLTGTERLFGPAPATGARLKEEVRRHTGLAISVGIGPNRYLAKMATNAGKPDGLVEVLAEQAEEFLDRIPLKDLWGIGDKTLARLTELNITSVTQLRGMPQPELARLLGRGACAFLSAACRGHDPGIFGEEPHSRSLSSEVTFERDRRDRAGIERVLLELSHQVMFRMLEGGWKSKTVALKLRFHDFTTVSAQRTIRHWIASADELSAVARELLESRWNGSTPVRLVGIGFSNLSPLETQDQLELFPDRGAKRGKVEEAVFRLQQRMGESALTKASLLKSGLHRTPNTNPFPRAGGKKPGEKPPGGKQSLPGPTSPSGRPAPSEDPSSPEP